MLTLKPWKLDAVVRLLLSVFICIFAGALIAQALQFSGSHKARLEFYAITGAALGFLAVALARLRKPWHFENFIRQSLVLLVCFYAGLFLGGWAAKTGGKVEPSTNQMLVSTLSFQGATLVLVGLFLREHQMSWSEAFGLRNRRPMAILLGVIVACLFLPLGRELQELSAEVMLRLPRLHLKPEDQQAVHVLQTAVTWRDRLTLGLITILLAPPAEELLFRGILYPWVKQSGFPRLALWGTSLAFGAVHLNLVSFVPLTVLALALTLLYERTSNLLAPITAHAMFNAMNFAWLYLSEFKLH